MPIIIEPGIRLGAGVTITPHKPEGTVDGSIQFNGTNYISVLAGQAGQITNMENNDFTWECFVYPQTVDSYQTFFDTRTATIGGDSTGFFFGTPGGSANPIVYSNSQLLASSVSLNLNAWNHVALTRVSGTISIWINGTNAGSQAGINAGLSQQRVFIGGSTNSALNFTGYIASARIVNGIAVYTGSFAPSNYCFNRSQDAGQNVSAISAPQTALLLRTISGDSYLNDNSQYSLIVNNTGGVESSTQTPF